MSMTWYEYIIVGFGIVVYIHCPTIRHIIHWLVIKLLQGIIWLLKKTDLKWREPKVSKGELPVANVKGTSELAVTDKELSKLLKRNPDLSISERTKEMEA